MTVDAADPRACPTCGDPLTFEILDDERFLVAWSCVNCGLIARPSPRSSLGARAARLPSGGT
jgi:rubredoxin